MQGIGFDNQKYLTAQLAALRERITKFDTLYLELGGRLTFDGHASRVLPGYDPTNKIKLLRSLGKEVGVLYCINSKVLESGKHWSDTGLSLEELTLKETRELEKNGLSIEGIVATRFNHQKKVLAFKRKVEGLGKRFFTTSSITGYPHDLKKIFGPRGFSNQPYIPTTKKLIVVTGAGANSGKMFVCLSQVYHAEQKGIRAGYAKFETFPIWNLPVNHPVNVAYEAATADIGDKVMEDPLHKKHYHITAVNYNRDIENFYILSKIIQHLVPKENFMHTYYSPTDMGMNRAKEGIIHDNLVQEASIEEIKRREEFYAEHLRLKQRVETMHRMQKIFAKVGLLSLKK